jgi:hypothetical protein
MELGRLVRYDPNTQSPVNKVYVVEQESVFGLVAGLGLQGFAA